MSTPPSSSPLSLVRGGGRLLGSWNVLDAAGVLPGAVRLRLERDTDGATLEVVVSPRGGQALVQTKVGGVSYKRFTGFAEKEAAEVTRSFAQLLDEGAVPLAVWFPHLAMEATPSAGDRARFAELVAAQLRLLPGRVEGASTDDLLPVERDRLYFDPPGLAEFLAPELAVDGAPVAGHVLRTISLPAVGKRQALDFHAYLLELSSEATGDVVRLRLSAQGRDDGFGRVGELSVGVLGHTGDLDGLPPEVASLCSWLLALLRLKHSERLEVFVPTRTEELRALAWPERTDGARARADEAERSAPPPSLNLAIDSDCGQACAFCSVKSYVRPSDGGDEEFERILHQLRAARGGGVDEVRLNGIDPLTYSRVLDVVAAVRDLGFPKLAVYSPCRRLADERFRRELLRRAPPALTISVPLYGPDAATHDAVTGTPGSFAQAFAAFEALRAELRPPAKLRLSTVIVRQNARAFVDVVRLAIDARLPLDAHVPYPMRQTTRDPYAESVVREREIVERFVERAGEIHERDRRTAIAMLGGAVVHPCLLLAAEKRTRLPLFGAREVRERPLLPGTEYRGDQFVHGEDGGQSDAFAVATVACPHAARCALAPVCPGEHYAVYQSLFGLDEFQPVTAWDLYATAPHPSVVPHGG